MTDKTVGTGKGLEEERWRREAEVIKKDRGDLEEDGTGRQKGPKVISYNSSKPTVKMQTVECLSEQLVALPVGSSSKVVMS
ncbi:hypothetical protein WISP_86718 [Willisornis vidua]|uniref:PEST proteolytic signal-containing nuclear protein n=1 Tax=Willisornis vidua TaxID=1566151 RepID=A0ABQ9D2U1_9PASS|nr:hypothetical protein WISP_86718 [Willisornis vidua]